ncbi:hypothetical protein BRC86_05870 [Halobacteriales archaeon QS_3_64_16]|nr:MAG: hypothetical protein BRC86_05870 [Halobacteriales archaeon QS_3_64_16]
MASAVDQYRSERVRRSVRSPKRASDFGSFAREIALVALVAATRLARRTQAGRDRAPGRSSERTVVAVREELPPFSQVTIAGEYCTKQYTNSTGCVCTSGFPRSLRAGCARVRRSPRRRVPTYDRAIPSASDPLGSFTPYVALGSIDFE